jgi:Uma2 family endonuclease
VARSNPFVPTGWLRLGRALDDAAAAGPGGEVFVAPLDVELSLHDVVQPDLLWVSAPRLAVERDRLAAIPELVVEILSPSSRRLDEVLKRRRYEQFGVEELWVVDPEVEAVRVYRREGEGFARPVELSGERGDALATPLLPALALPVAPLFGG